MEISVNEQAVHDPFTPWSSVDMFLTDKLVNSQAMMNTLASMWRPVKGVHIRELGHNLFLFQFFHELDVQRVVGGGLWMFDRQLLLIRRLELDMDNQQVLMVIMDIWVQVHDLLGSFRTKTSVRRIGASIGEVPGSSPEGARRMEAECPGESNT